MATIAERSHEPTQASVQHDLQDILAETEQTSHSSGQNSSVPSVVVAKLAKLTDSGPLVQIHNQTDVPAKTTVPLNTELIGCEVVLAFENGNPALPIIMGVIAQHEPSIPATSQQSESETTAFVDGERVVLEGRKEIVLKCGKASITLTRAGKVLIQGAYLSSRSTGAHRIRGGSVHIN